MSIAVENPKRRKDRKTQRLVARVSAEDKMIIAQAAAISGQSIGSFIVSEVRHAAVQRLEKRQRILLNAAQSRRFVEALLAPPRPPTKRMVEAMRAYRATVKSDLD